MGKLILFSFLLFGSLIVQSQTKTQNATEDLIQAIIENAGSDFDFTDLFAKLDYWQRHPLDLQSVGRDELKQIPLLSEIQIEQFLAHRNRYGAFLSVYELQAVDGWDLKTAQLLAPFLTVLGTPMAQNSDDKHDLMIRSRTNLPLAFGYSDTTEKRYLGSPIGNFIRYKYSYGNRLTLGFVAENDPGEAFRFDSAQLGFDFTSGHVQWMGRKWVKKVIVGDYNVQFGQGLTAWSGLAFGKSPFVLNILRQGRGIVPYTSANEAQYFRGGAMVLAHPRIPMELSLFTSLKNSDANLRTNNDSVFIGEDLVISGLNLSGYHRTLSELADRKSVKTTQMGGNLKWKFSSGNIGFTVLHSTFSKPFLRSAALYDRFDFQGNQILNVGFDHQFTVKNLLVWGEVSHGDSGWAVTEGILIPLDARLTLAAMYRNFSPKFHSLFGSAIAENTLATNEQGFYFGFQASPRKKWTVSSYIDRFVFPWLRFGVDAPSSGWETLVNIEYTPNRKSSFYVRGRYRLKQENSSVSASPIAPLVDYSRYGIRGNAKFSTGDMITWQTRLEWSGFQKETNTENGFALFQDFQYKKLSSPITFNLRWAWFQTPSFNTAIYAYESDLLYYFSVPALYGNGSRMYALVKWDLAKNMELSSKFGVFHSKERNEWGSGVDLVTGSVKYDWRIQWRMVF